VNNNIGELKELFNNSPELFFTSQYTSEALTRTSLTKILDFWLEIHLRHGVELKYDFDIFRSYASIKFWCNVFKKYNLVLPKTNENSRIKIVKKVIDKTSCATLNECDGFASWYCQSINITQLIEACELMYEL